jgi:IstB-like ATP binding protein
VLRAHPKPEITAARCPSTIGPAVAELITERIRRNARELKLYGLLKSADALIERAEQGRLGYREFLRLVLEDELAVLESRRYQSRLKMAGLPNHKTLDEFDASFQPELDPKRLRELRTLRFLERRIALLIFGPSDPLSHCSPRRGHWSNSPASTLGTRMRSLLRRPLVTWTASSSPRWTCARRSGGRRRAAWRPLRAARSPPGRRARSGGGPRR